MSGLGNRHQHQITFVNTGSVGFKLQMVGFFETLNQGQNCLFDWMGERSPGGDHFFMVTPALQVVEPTWNTRVLLLPLEKAEPLSTGLRF